MSRFELSAAPQGSEEWKAARLGRVTGSGAAAVLAEARKKGDVSVTRRNYIFQLACERLTGKSAESPFTNRHTERGNELEPRARLAYEAETGRLVHEAGFAYLPDMMAGCSVDGFVKDEARRGIGEYKCPIPAIHFAYMQEKGAPASHLPQINHNLWITGLEFCDFSSYCEEFPEHLQLHTVRVERDEKVIEAYETEVLKFLDEVDVLVKKLERRAA